MRRIVGVGLAAILVVAVALLAAGCASTKTKDWKGHAIAEVVKAFGPATRSVPAAGGNVVHTFDQKRDVLCGITATDHVSGQVQGSLGGVCGIERRAWTFVVDSGGAVASWSVGAWERMK